MSYRVFARKYRPQTFEEVVGQDHITRTLQNAIAADRLAQAYLFVGPRGIGKTSTARILAKALNCEKGPTISPCGICSACVEIAEGRSLDVSEIDGASNNSVENIRDLRDTVAYAPARGPYKIYLIDEVHMLSAGAFNALLKTLEEPPPHVKFIFATTEAQKLPATITSRCQRFDLRRIPTPLIAKHLLVIAGKEDIDLEPAAAEVIARGAEGGLRDAESMFDQVVAFCGGKITAVDVMDVFGFTARETVADLSGKIFASDVAGALALISTQSDAGKDLSRLLADLILYLRDLLVAQASGQAAGDIPGITQANLLDLLDHFAETETRMKWASDRKLQLDVAIIKAVHLLEEASLTDVIEMLSDFGSAAPGTPVAVNPRPVAKPQPVAPVAVLAPAPAPVSAPVAKISVREEPQAAAPRVATPAPQPVASVQAKEADGTLASAVWEKVVGEFGAKSFIRFGWLREGVFSSLSAGVMVVRVSPDEKAHVESIFWAQSSKDIEARLSQEMGSKVSLKVEFDDTMATAPVLVAEEIPEAREEPGPIAPPAPPADPMEEFKNDPLIKKALEIFKSELQTVNT